jgi:hypothetical protein
VVDKRENDRAEHDVDARPFCTLQLCPKFDVEKYLHQLRQALPHVPPISGWELRSLHEAQDYEGMVRLVRKTMNVEVKLKVGWVNSGGPESAVAWIILPHDMPLYGTKEFNDMTITMYLKKSLLKERTSDQVSIAIAHELSHVVLESTRHPLRKCEKAVDLTTMLLGFGRLFETASHTKERVGDYIKTFDLGYLSEKEMRAANEILTPDHLRLKIKALRESPPTPSPRSSKPSGRNRDGWGTGRLALALLLLGVFLGWLLGVNELPRIWQPSLPAPSNSDSISPPKTSHSANDQTLDWGNGALKGNKLEAEPFTTFRVLENTAKGAGCKSNLFPTIEEERTWGSGCSVGGGFWRYWCTNGKAFDFPEDQPSPPGGVQSICSAAQRPANSH